MTAESWYAYCAPLDEEARRELGELKGKAEQALGVSVQGDPAGAVQAAYDDVQLMLDESGALGEEESLGPSMVLGALFGAAVCQSYGWVWCRIGESDEAFLYGLRSPEGLYCTFPLSFMQRILTGQNIGPDGENDNTVMLLFNMLDGVERTIPEKLLTPLM